MRSSSAKKKEEKKLKLKSEGRFRNKLIADERKVNVGSEFQTSTPS